MRALLERQLVSFALVDEEFRDNLPDGFDWREHVRGELARAIVESCLAMHVPVSEGGKSLRSSGMLGDAITSEALVVRMLVDRDGYSRRAVEDYIAGAHRSPSPVGVSVITTTDAAAALMSSDP